MKLAILMMCHKSPEQINMFVKQFENQNVDIFIHIDKKANIDGQITRANNVYILPNERRKDVQWAQISQVDATLQLIEYAKSFYDYDFYWLVSGQDYPIKDVTEIIDFLKGDLDKNYLNLFNSMHHNLGTYNNYDKRNQIIFPKWMISRKKYMRIIKRLYIEITGGYKKTFKVFLRKNIFNMKYYFGSQWWCINKRTMMWMMVYLKDNPDYYKYFKNCLCPDESFFHTLIMNSPYNQQVMDYLHYIDWSQGLHSPKTLTIDDLPKLESSSKFMARKFDLNIDMEVVNCLSKKKGS